MRRATARLVVSKLRPTKLCGSFLIWSRHSARVAANTSCCCPASVFLRAGEGGCARRACRVGVAQLPATRCARVQDVGVSVQVLRRSFEVLRQLHLVMNDWLGRLEATSAGRLLAFWLSPRLPASPGSAFAASLPVSIEHRLRVGVQLQFCLLQVPRYGSAAGVTAGPVTTGLSTATGASTTGATTAAGVLDGRNVCWRGDDSFGHCGRRN